MLTLVPPWCHCHPLRCRGTRASVAVGMRLAPAWDPLCLGQGASATSRPPSSSRCNGDSDVRPCSNVPIPHGPAGASVPPLGVLRDRICPFSRWEGAELSLCAFPAVPTRQHPAGTWSSGTCHHCGLRVATPPYSHPACRGPLFPCPLPTLLLDHLLCAPACQRDLDLPLGVLLLPHPQPLLALLGCNTNHLGPAGQREPQNSPLYLGGVLPARPTTSGLGAGEQHGSHSGSGGLGTVALL